METCREPEETPDPLREEVPSTTRPCDYTSGASLLALAHGLRGSGVQVFHQWRLDPANRSPAVKHVAVGENADGIQLSFKRKGEKRSEGGFPGEMLEGSEATAGMGGEALLAGTGGQSVCSRKKPSSSASSSAEQLASVRVCSASLNGNGDDGGQGPDRRRVVLLHPHQAPQNILLVAGPPVDVCVLEPAGDVALGTHRAQHTSLRAGPRSRPPRPGRSRPPAPGLPWWPQETGWE